MKCGKCSFGAIYNKTKNQNDSTVKTFKTYEKARIILCPNCAENIPKPKQFEEITQKGFSSCLYY